MQQHVMHRKTWQSIYTRQLHEVTRIESTGQLNLEIKVKKITLTIATANDAGIKEKAMLTMTAAEKASRSCDKICRNKSNEETIF